MNIPYPQVLGESSTLARVLAGASLARYGDGEFKFCKGGAIKSQQFESRLSERLRRILHDSGDCLVGIPNITLESPKYETTWKKYLGFADLLIDRAYVSAFITRPDSAPWINTPAYWAQLESLWVDQDVTLVRGSSKSLTAEDLVGARMVTEIVAPRQHAFSEYKTLLNRIGTPARALLCLGPTATVMAVDLCAKGVHAIDLGHIGMFLRKYRRGEPMWVTETDKAPA
jgi:hypothetical protein